MINLPVVQEMSPAFKLFKLLKSREGGTSGPVKGLMVTVKEDVANDYYKEVLPTLPAGTQLEIDFGGDFGIYAVADVDGVLHKVKVKLEELHKLDWAPHKELLDRIAKKGK